MKKKKKRAGRGRRIQRALPENSEMWSWMMKKMVVTGRTLMMKTEAEEKQEAGKEKEKETMKGTRLQGEASSFPPPSNQSLAAAAALAVLLLPAVAVVAVAAVAEPLQSQWRVLLEGCRAEGGRGEPLEGAEDQSSSGRRSDSIAINVRETCARIVLVVLFECTERAWTGRL